MAEVCKDTAAKVVGYDYDAVVAEDDENIAIWSDALKDCDVAICTVHPPRDSFHCSVFAAKCIKQNRLKTILVPKTGTIVPEYKREFYQLLEYTNDVDLNKKLKDWEYFYNFNRPHGAFKGKTPYEVLKSKLVN